MTRRATGMMFIGISTFIFSVRYVAAAIYGAGISIENQYSEESFQKSLSYIGSTPLFLSIVALVVGIIFIVWAEVEKRQ